VIGLNVAWETLSANPVVIAEANNHPSGTLGVKYFPGATAPGGTWVDLLGLRITTDPPVQGVRVFLKAFDPDDPSANNDVVDNNLTGGDNRDDNHHDTAELGVTQITTGGTGQALTSFRVAHQPGDNHRVAATIKQTTQGVPTLDMLNDNNVPPSNTQNPPTQDQVQLFIGNLSPLLTVWRTLHVEIDSMGAVAANSIAGTILGVTDLDPFPQTKFQIPDLPGDFEETNHFNPGQITIEGFAGNFTTVGTEVRVGSDFVIIQNQAGTDFAGAVGANFTLFDDDVGLPGFPPAVALPRLPDATLMHDVYGRAYISIDLLAVPPQSQTNIPFDRNLTLDALGNPSEAITVLDDSKNVASSQQYWVAHVVSVFQGTLARDADPDSEEGTHPDGLLYGLTDVQGWPFPWAWGGSVIFLETIRDKGAAPQNVIDLERFTVAHEVGHQFELEHEDGAEDPPGSGTFMMLPAPNDVFPDNLEFSPTSLGKIRSIDFPQDE